MLYTTIIQDLFYSLLEYFFQGLAKQLLFPVIPQFTQAFVEALLVPDGPSSDSGLKMEIMKVGIKKYGLVTEYFDILYCLSENEKCSWEYLDISTTG